MSYIENLDAQPYNKHSDELVPWLHLGLSISGGYSEKNSRVGNKEEEVKREHNNKLDENFLELGIHHSVSAHADTTQATKTRSHRRLRNTCDEKSKGLNYKHGSTTTLEAQMLKVLKPIVDTKWPRRTATSTKCPQTSKLEKAPKESSFDALFMEEKLSFNPKNLECYYNVKRSHSRRKQAFPKKTSNYSFPFVQEYSLTKEESKIIACLSGGSSPRQDLLEVDSVMVLDAKGYFCTLGELRDVMFDGGQMTSPVVRAISASFNLYWNLPNSSSNRLILDPSFMQTAIHGKKREKYDIRQPSFTERLQKVGSIIMKSTHWQSCSIFFVPCCLENHWFCYSFNLRDKRIEVLDSLHSSTYHEDMNIKQAVCQAFKLAFNTIDHSFSMEDWEYHDAKVPRQPDGHSCGHYMMTAIKLWNGCWNCDASELEAYFIDRGRTLIAKVLLGNFNVARSSVLELINKI